MTKEEYKSKYLEINHDYQLKLKSLVKEYAMSNNWQITHLTLIIPNQQTK